MIAGRYTLEREVGRGGTGAVHLGRDEVLGRQVALKRIGMVPGDESPDLVRAEREARLAAKLNHPHVVAVYDLVVEDDHQWLVMEYVEGETLAQRIRRRGRLETQEAASLLWQTADALTEAHAHDIVHRDVKPSNILVTGADQAKLTDFGIARALADSSLTQTGLVTGSPAYLAPEVASGSTATAASDVWSLGATLFHALAGHAPYDVGGNLIGGLYKIVNEEPPRLPDAGPMAEVLEHTMVRDPDRRWTMAQVRDHLDALRRGETPTRVVPVNGTTHTPVQPVPVTASTPDGPSAPDASAARSERSDAPPAAPRSPRRRRSPSPGSSRQRPHCSWGSSCSPPSRTTPGSPPPTRVPRPRARRRPARRRPARRRPPSRRAATHPARSHPPSRPPRPRPVAG